MIKREELATELLLREHIKKAIGVVLKRRKERQKKELNEEKELRNIIRQVLRESDPAISTAAVHSNTGINALEDLFKSTNLLTVLRQGYKSLTSKKEQRDSYLSHILNAVENSFKTEDARGPEIEEVDPSTETIDIAEQEKAIQEDVNIDVGTGPENNPAFIDVEKKEPSEDEEVETFTISGQDKTGRNRAFTDYKNVEKNILTAYDNLDDPVDRDMFKDYLLTNLKLYFERFEEELQVDLPEPDIETPEASEAESEVNLNPEEMLEWLVLSAMKK